MQNMLHRFYDVCGGNYIQAIILNNLYHEAHQHVKNGDYTTMIDLTELRDHIGLKFCDENYLSGSVFIPIGEGMDRHGKQLLDYDFDAFYNGSNNKFSCVIHLDEMENRLEICSLERLTVERNNKRAEVLGLPATLTLARWMRNLNLHHWECAYCSHQWQFAISLPYEVLEHIVPLTFPDSGTTVLNCVPACKKCNSLKGPYHPDRMPHSIKEKIGDHIERVRRCMTSWNGWIEHP